MARAQGAERPQPRRGWPIYEHRTEPLLSHRAFMGRLARSVAFAVLVVACSLAVGMVGYRMLEGRSWLDAFLESAMLLGGMGPITPPATDGGKLFAGLYALYCGLVVIFVAGIVLAPVAHRVLHRFHVEDMP